MDTLDIKPLQETDIPLPALVGELMQLKEQAMIPESDLKFANNLINFFQNNDTLSPKQQYWVKKLIEKSVCGAEDVNALKTQALGHYLSPLMGFFVNATQHTKYPKIRVTTATGSPLQLALAGSKSKYSGKILLTDGKDYPNNRWYGTVDVNGDWIQSKEVVKSNSLELDILDMLVLLAKSPETVAKTQAMFTGACCFCGNELPKDLGATLGYDGKCAGIWSLPWMT